MFYILTTNLKSVYDVTFLGITLHLNYIPTLQDGRISYEEFAAMMKAGTDWRKASRQYSRERFNSLSLKLMRDGSLQQLNKMEVR